MCPSVRDRSQNVLRLVHRREGSVHRDSAGTQHDPGGGVVKVREFPPAPSLQALWSDVGTLPGEGKLCVGSVVDNGWRCRLQKLEDQGPPCSNGLERVYTEKKKDTQRMYRGHAESDL